MTKERAKELQHIYEAFVNGKKIEIANHHGEWIEADNIGFGAHPSKYRIIEPPKSYEKPRTKYSCNNLFVYGTLALSSKREELGLTCQTILQYDYIKGYSLNEIEDEGIYLQATQNIDSSVGIITGRILFGCNLEECMNVLDEWEGEQYERVLVTTEVHHIECMMYVRKK